MSNNRPELGLITRRIRGCRALRDGSVFRDNSSPAGGDASSRQIERGEFQW